MTTAAPDSLYLSRDQQDLLLAALTSNSSSSPMFNTPALSQHMAASVSGRPSRGSSYDQSETSPQSAGFANGTPLLNDNLEFAEWEPDFEIDGPWDYDFSLGSVHEQAQSSTDSVDGSENKATEASPQPVPGAQNKRENEKRKDPPASGENGSVDPHDAEPKRRESENNDKVAKKPGRKPLTEAPTSKRKAQNRAAQRAFRERKEKHLRDLENKVQDLEKASESANHENSLLRAQVDRLQTEVKEYRRRLHSSEIARGSSNLASGLGGFQFDFPPFGSGLFANSGRNGSIGDKDKAGLRIGPGTLMERLNGTNAGSPMDKPSPSSTNGSSTSSSSKYSPRTPASSVASQMQLDARIDPNAMDTDFMKGLESMHSTPRLNTGTASSPSASSVSQRGPNSSCGTSPEPSTNSPTSLKPLNSINEEAHKLANDDEYICKSGLLGGENETTFCEKLGMACGNPNNPIPKAPAHPVVSTPPAAIDWMSQHSNSAFDPVIFNDYREPGNQGIGMSFFDDAFPMANFDNIGSPPPTTNGTAAPVKVADPIAACDAVVDGGDDDEEEVMPADDMKQMLSCNKIWDRISTHPRFVSGELDMDGLCSELRSKAKCSEAGVVVAENDVKEVLGKVGMSHKEVS